MNHAESVREFIRRDRFAVDPNALSRPQQMRRREQSRAKSGGAQTAFDHRAG
jgi:hypothetical protein